MSRLIPEKESLTVEFKSDRKDAAGLCRINENQASHLLRKLHKSGKLKLLGSGRGAYYQIS